MKKKSRQRGGKALSNADSRLPRTEALLAQILLHSMSDAGQQKKALALRAVGFSNTEIAQLMSTTADLVAQVLYLARRDRAMIARPKRPKRRKH
jgi:hypothetical protein